LSNNGWTTQQYNVVLSGLSQQTLPNGVYLYAQPTPYGGCDVSNRAAGITGRTKLTNDKGRTIIDGGMSNCIPLPLTSNG
jgi:hypothetical protein